MAVNPSAFSITFRQGQLDALAKTHLAPDGLLTPELRHSLALRLLNRAWAQYREDRAIELGERLVGGECAAERDAFLTLMTQSLRDREGSLAQAVSTVRRSVAAPLAAEARHAAKIAEAGVAQIDAVLATLTSSQLPSDPLERLLKALSQHRYSLSNDSDALRATSHSPCWAFNLLAVARPETFKFCPTDLPFPGVVRRRLFRADMTAHSKREVARETILAAMHETAYDIDRAWKANRRFASAFPDLRSNSRLQSVWLLLVGLGEVTSAQVARALPATRAGASKLLRQLAGANLVRNNGPFAPFVCNPIPAATFASGGD